MKKEIWKDVKNYEGLYQVSDKGRVRTVRIFRSNIKCVNLWKNGEYKGVTVAKLVAMMFVPNPDNKPLVYYKKKYHKNIPSNLRWGTQQDNILNAVKRGTFPTKARLKEKQVKEIRRKYIPCKYNLETLAKEYDVTISTISNTVNYKSWKNI